MQSLDASYSGRFFKMALDEDGSTQCHAFGVPYCAKAKVASQLGLPSNCALSRYFPPLQVTLLRVFYCDVAKYNVVRSLSHHAFLRW